MKKKLVLFLLVCGLVLGIGSVPNVQAGILTYWDLDFTGDGNAADGTFDSFEGPAGSQTALFDEIGYTAQTSSWQFDDDGNAGRTVGDSFRDFGHVQVDGLQHNDVAVWDSYLNQQEDSVSPGVPAFDGYEVTMHWDDLWGTIKDINPGTGTEALVTEYLGGTINFYIDDSPDIDPASFGGDPYYEDDTHGDFVGGELFAQIQVTGGHGGITFDISGGAPGDPILGSYTINGLFTMMDSGLWYDQYDQDLAPTYMAINWLVGYTHGDSDKDTMDIDNSVLGGYQFFRGEDREILYTVGTAHEAALSVNVIPEPATMLLLGSGLIGLAGLGRKKKFFKKG